MEIGIPGEKEGAPSYCRRKNGLVRTHCQLPELICVKLSNRRGRAVGSQGGKSFKERVPSWPPRSLVFTVLQGKKRWWGEVPRGRFFRGN